MREIDGDLLFGEVGHNHFTHGTAILAGDLAKDALGASGDHWVASMKIVTTPEVVEGGGFRVGLTTSTEYDAAELREMAGTSCRGLVIRQAGSAALHPSVEGVVEALRTGNMAQSASA